VKPERERELLDRLDAPDAARPGPLGERSRRNPAAAYASPERFARERDALFRGLPNLVGLSAECANPGDFLAADLGGVPALVVRQADGSLRGFVNACRHRASTLLDGCGSTGRMIACPYHGWVYELDGRLRARPRRRGRLRRRAARRARPVPLRGHERRLIFARAARAFTVDRRCTAPGGDRELRPESYCPIETRTHEFPINWKLVVDTFTEAYHIPWLHKTTIAPHYFFDRWIYDAYGPHGRFVGVRKSATAELEKPRGSERRLLPHATTQYLLLPNAILCHQIDHVELWRLVPLAVDRTRVSTSIFAPKPPASEKERRYWVKNLDVLLQVTTTEDFPAMARIQQNLMSGAVPEVVYGKMEPALVHFHAAVDAALAAAP
jgi:phenylpropionate dioxygenase-like ring-hydroxylating dioxygenase large terminal subunit